MYANATVADVVALMLCDTDAVDPDTRLKVVAMKSQFLLETEEEDKLCREARSSVGQPISDRVNAAYKKDGKQVFCSWVVRMFSSKSVELFDRFLD